MSNPRFIKPSEDGAAVAAAAASVAANTAVADDAAARAAAERIAAAEARALAAEERATAVEKAAAERVAAVEKAAAERIIADRAAVAKDAPTAKDAPAVQLKPRDRVHIASLRQGRLFVYDGVVSRVHADGTVDAQALAGGGAWGQLALWQHNAEGDRDGYIVPLPGAPAPAASPIPAISPERQQ
jgi:hypothetical protein